MAKYEIEREQETRESRGGNEKKNEVACNT